jgi:urease accessory protein
MRLMKSLTVAAASFACAASAFAHSQTGGAHDFTHGLVHPVSGVDHLAAMVAVGLWASQLGGRALWLLPLTFVGAMSLGGAGLTSLGVAFPHEALIVASVVLLGVLVTFRVEAPLSAAAATIAVFAAAHGLAHWAESPTGANQVDYALGFALTTLILHIAGAVFGVGLAHRLEARAVQGLGAAVFLTGMALMAA